LEKDVNRYAIGVFDSLLIFLSVLMGLCEVSKKIIDKKENLKDE